MEPGSDDRDRIHPNASSPPKTDADVAPLIQKVGAPSIAQIEKLIGELHEARNLLESEGERVQREAEHYTTLTQMASASVKIIADTVAGWREAGHPLRDHSRSSRFDLTRSPAEDNTDWTSVPDQHQPQSQRRIRARTRGKQSPETASGEEQSSPV